MCLFDLWFSSDIPQEWDCRIIWWLHFYKKLKIELPNAGFRKFFQEMVRDRINVILQSTCPRTWGVLGQGKGYFGTHGAPSSWQWLCVPCLGLIFPTVSQEDGSSRVALEWMVWFGLRETLLFRADAVCSTVIKAHHCESFWNWQMFSCAGSC